jgi:hypothetical protein
MEEIKKEIPKENNDINLLKIIDEVYARKIQNNDFSKILEFTNKFEINHEEIQEEYKNKNTNDFIEIFKNENESHTNEKIFSFISDKGLADFLYLFLILKTKGNALHKKIVNCLTLALSLKPDNEQAQSIQKSFPKQLKSDELKIINDQVGTTNKFIRDFKKEAYEKINDIDNRINNIFPQLQKILSAISVENRKDELATLGELSNPVVSGLSGNNKSEIPQMPTQDVQPKSIISKFKNNSSLILQFSTFIFIAIISFFLFFTDTLKPSVSETKLDSSKLVSDLNTNVSTSIKPITEKINSLDNKINSLDNKIKVLGTKDPQIKQLDENEIGKIKTGVDTVVKEFFKDKKLIIDSDKLQIFTTKTENSNTVAAPKDEVKGKGEEKKGKDNQPKGTPPSHKVTADDKKDIAKITSEAIKSIIEQEIRKISSNNDKSKDKTSELASKVTEFNELQVKQVQLKAELDSQKKLVGEKDKILLEFNKVKDGFKGYQGSFAILFTNSKDFPLNENILSTCFTVIEKQPKNQNIGVYIATGNKIAVNLDLRDKKEKLLSLISPIGSPTETLGDAGQDFLDRAFEGEKTPIPVPDRKVIIVATWSAEAPKSNSSGWKDISQVDAILIQPANVQQIRYAKSWFDFVNQKNGRLLLISGGDNFDASSDNLKQLSKQISTLLNTKKD